MNDNQTVHFHPKIFSQKNFCPSRLQSSLIDYSIPLEAMQQLVPVSCYKLYFCVILCEILKHPKNVSNLLLYVPQKLSSKCKHRICSILFTISVTVCSTKEFACNSSFFNFKRWLFIMITATKNKIKIGVIMSNLWYGQRFLRQMVSFCSDA